MVGVCTVTDSPQNIVHVTVDSLRADQCGFLEPTAETTPALDSLAAESTVFESAIAPAPRTPTAIPETLTGAFMPKGTPETHADQFARIRNHLADHDPLPKYLSEADYTTIAFVGNPWLTRRSGIDEWFDEFHDLGVVDHESRFRRMALSTFGGSTIGDVALWIDRWRHRRGFFSQWETYVDELFETLRDTEPPYYVWVFLMEPHNPYIAPPGDRVENSTLDMYYGLLRGNEIFHPTESDSSLKHELTPHVERRVKRAYRDTIRSVDRFVGRLQTVLDDDHLLVFHSDHGEAFDEHGTYGHRHRLYEENIHVPFFIRDATTDDGTVVEDPVSLRDLPELVLDRVTTDASISTSGRDEEYVVARTESAEQIALRTNQYKYIYDRDSGELVFDLAADPGERTDLSEMERDRCQRWQSIVEGVWDDLPELPGAESGSVPASTVERLESLGYK